MVIHLGGQNIDINVQFKTLGLHYHVTKTFQLFFVNCPKWSIVLNSTWVQRFAKTQDNFLKKTKEPYKKSRFPIFFWKMIFFQNRALSVFCNIVLCLCAKKRKTLERFSIYSRVTDGQASSRRTCNSWFQAHSYKKKSVYSKMIAQE